MNKTQETLLEKAGWTVECLSPLELRHAETGSFATGLAADYVISEVEREVSRLEGKLAASELRALKFPDIVQSRTTALVLALLQDGIPAAANVLKAGYAELQEWQVGKELRAASRIWEKEDTEILADVVKLADAFIRTGSSGVYDRMFMLMTAVAESS